ncbi:Tol biopolymer transport system component [Pedobacter cryoconitis]|uniref:hypothetical protein n=1 Tax=Pedobacter cryoconitis TaxID=188932 RepID=UPI0016170930|nr:hypothetical protein [Pedobacter cryoconitis]MBB6273143.1 Tol biopolymer transport system component [Pedobacter cryoconitis]
MKKILLSTIVLFAFSLSILLFQVSCKKEATAKTSTPGQNSLNIILYAKSFNSNNSYSQEIWMSGYDGSNQKKINIQLPSGIVFSEGIEPKLSPDGKTIFFEAGAAGSSSGNISYQTDLYSCNIDGSNLKKVIDHGTASGIHLGDIK